MMDEAVLEVGVDGGGRLFVRPAETSFDQIFRAGMGVSWDGKKRALVSSEPRQWILARWFQQILAAAADGYGVALRLTPSTKWSNVPPELQREIETYSTSDWLTQFLWQRKQDDARYWRDHQIGQALSQADPLWAQGRYTEYVGILAPHRHQLSPAQLKRLSIAERRAQADS